MHIPLDLSAASWHFKRAVQKADGSPHEQWRPSLEATNVCNAAEVTYRGPSGSLDPRLDQWMPVTSVPNDPFLLLQKAGIIPDPSFSLNEDIAQCKRTNAEVSESHACTEDHHDVPFPDI